MKTIVKAAAFAMTAATMAFVATPSMANINNSGTVSACGKVKTAKCLNASVRNTQLGQEYRTPGSAWKSCRGDCATQLRRDKIDFWFYQGG